MSETNQIAYVFPGQGSQKTGMGRDLYESFESAKVVFQEADEALGFPISKLCFEGPEDELRQTVNAQPALLTVSYACYKAALEISNGKAGPPSFLAGHSLGEYTALAVADVLDFPAAVCLARERGRLMHEAGQLTPGAMAAVLGMDEDSVTSLCQETGTWLANINCPGQLVISGSAENIKKAIALAQSRGALKALPLQVSGAFHSPLMRPAADGLSAAIARLSFKDPAVPIIANTSAAPLTNSTGIKEELINQLGNSVQWQRSIEFMIDKGVTTFIEIGPGKVLTGLTKRINKSVSTLNISNASELDNLANP